MKFENLYINEALTNGLIDSLKTKPHLIGFVFAAIDHKFKVSLPGCIECAYNKVRLLTHTSGSDCLVWVIRTGEKEVIIKWDAETFHWNNVEVIRGALYYDNKFICKTT